MERQGTRGMAVVAVIACALVSGWATIQRERHEPAPIDVTAVDTARLKREGFFPASRLPGRATREHARYFKRFSDGATFTAIWNVYPPREAKVVWDRRRFRMSGNRATGQPLPSGKPLNGGWMYPAGAANGGVFGIDAIHQGVIVEVELHYARTPRSQGHKWIVRNPRRDERLVEDVPRSPMARLATSPPIDRLEIVR